jgi:dTMP kinase
MPRSRGRFITFEGLDGCGKTTQLKKLADALARQGVEVVTTREPGGTPIGEKVRAVLLDSRTEGMAPLAELALMFGARAQHIHQVIEPALRAGKWVLCDRFTDSSEAYQGGGRQLGVGNVLALHKILCGNLQPDLTLLLLSDPRKSVQRARGRNQRNRHIADEGRFEMERGAFFDRAFKTYQAIARREPKRVVKIVSTHTIPEVQKEIWQAVQSRLLKKAK